MPKLSKKEARTRRHRRARQKICGTPEIPRMAVCCTSKHVYVQLIDDTTGHTLASVSTLDPDIRDAEECGPTVAGATLIGRTAAERAKAANITKAVFDRGGFRYHGKVKAVAEGARKAGLQL